MKGRGVEVDRTFSTELSEVIGDRDIDSSEVETELMSLLTKRLERLHSALSNPPLSNSNLLGTLFYGTATVIGACFVANAFLSSRGGNPTGSVWIVLTIISIASMGGLILVARYFKRSFYHFRRQLMLVGAQRPTSPTPLGIPALDAVQLEIYHAQIEARDLLFLFSNGSVIAAHESELVKEGSGD